MIEFACYNCGEILSVPDSRSGKTETCPVCKEKWPVPEVLVDWRNKPPTKRQLWYLKSEGFTIPPDATRGDLSNMIGSIRAESPPTEDPDHPESREQPVPVNSDGVFFTWGGVSLKMNGSTFTVSGPDGMDEATMRVIGEKYISLAKIEQGRALLIHLIRGPSTSQKLLAVILGIPDSAGNGT